VDIEFTIEPDFNRYAMRIDGELVALVDYSANGNAISLTRVYTAPHLRGRGLAAEVVAFAVDDIEQNTDLHIVPMCWYAAEWFEKHPEHANLLSRAA
jgi:predicted GNAT family acetyltransferase